MLAATYADRGRIGLRVAKDIGILRVLVLEGHANCLAKCN